MPTTLIRSRSTTVSTTGGASISVGRIRLEPKVSAVSFTPYPQNSPTMSTVSSAAVQSSNPTGQNRTNPAVTASGSSTGGFRFVGTIGSANCQIVLSATSNRATPVINTNKDGVVCDAGSVGTYLILTTNAANSNNWTVRARTTADGANNGLTFTAGSGGDMADDDADDDGGDNA